MKHLYLIPPVSLGLREVNMNLLPVGNVFGECEAVGGCARPNWGNLIFGRRPLLPLFTHHLLRALTSKYRSNKGQNLSQNKVKI